MLLGMVTVILEIWQSRGWSIIEMTKMWTENQSFFSSTDSHSFVAKLLTYAFTVHKNIN